MQSKFDPFTQLLEENKYFSKTFFKYLHAKSAFMPSAFRLIDGEMDRLLDR